MTNVAPLSGLVSFPSWLNWLVVSIHTYCRMDAFCNQAMDFLFSSLSYEVKRNGLSVSSTSMYYVHNPLFFHLHFLPVSF